MFGIQNERGIHRPHLLFGRCLTMQQMQKVTGNARIIRLGLDAIAVRLK